MWGCDCNSEGQHTNSFSLTSTTIDSEGICQRCKKTYAVWVNPENLASEDGTKINQKVTVFKLETGEKKFFDNTVDAAEWCGFRSERAIAMYISKDNPYYFSKKNKVAVCIGHYATMPIGLKKLTEKDIVHCFKYDTQEYVTKGTLDELAEKLGITKSVISAGLARRSNVSKKGGYVFARSKDFDIAAFCKIVKDTGTAKDKTFTFGSNWSEDVLGYDNDELGVKYEKDYYGTWQQYLFT